MKKIMFLLGMDTNRAGTERIMTVVANGLSDDYEVTVMTCWNQGGTPAFPFKDSVVQADLGMDRKAYTFRMMMKRDARRRLGLWLQENPQDVVVLVGEKSILSVVPQLKDGSKKVFWYHFCLNKDLIQLGDPSLSWASKLVRRGKRGRKIRLARKYDRVVVLTKQDCELWQRHCDNVTYIYNEVSIQPATVSDYGAKRAMAVGRLTYQKGFDHLIEAWKIVRKKFPDWQLDIYGEGKLRPALQRQIDEGGLSGCVHLVGTRTDMGSEYAGHSMAVMSSNFEGLPLALLEAAGCKLSLVSYDCECGPREVIEDGVNGYLVPKVGDPEGLAEAMMRLMGSEELRRTMGEASPQRLIPFSHEAVMARWHELIDEMTA